jgi:hypothetical protein
LLYKFFKFSNKKQYKKYSISLYINRSI